MTLTSTAKGNLNPIAAGFARTVSKRDQTGSVLFHAFPSHVSDAKPSFYGFAPNHYGGAGTAGAALPPLGLTRYPSMGPGYALKLSTPDRPLTHIPTSQNNVAAYKRLSRFFTESESSLISFSGYFASMPGRVAPGSNWSIGIDAQMWGSTDRSFFKASCRYPGGGAANWYLTDNSGAVVQLASSSRITAGLNQNKANFNYVEMIVKLNANSGRGQYYGLQVNNTYFDLTDTAVWADPTQSGQQSVQGSTTDPSSTTTHLLDFDGGLNFGVFFTGPGDDTSYPHRLICADLIATVFDAA
jgi:hypothetical protein